MDTLSHPWIWFGVFCFGGSFVGAVVFDVAGYGWAALVWVFLMLGARAFGQWEVKDAMRGVLSSLRPRPAAPGSEAS